MTPEEIIEKRAELSAYFEQVKTRRKEIVAMTKAYTAGLNALKTESQSITALYTSRLNEYYRLGDALRTTEKGRG